MMRRPYGDQDFDDAGPISLYFASQKLLPAKTSTFVDFFTDSLEERQARRAPL
jgi:hypothetical protein